MVISCHMSTVPLGAEHSSDCPTPFLGRNRHVNGTQRASGWPCGDQQHQVNADFQPLPGHPSPGSLEWGPRTCILNITGYKKF